MTRTIAIFAVSGAVLAMGAAVSVLARDGVPRFGIDAPAVAAVGPEANREGKTDKLAMARLALTTPAPEQAVAAALGEPLRPGMTAELAPLRTEPVAPTAAPSARAAAGTPGASLASLAPTGPEPKPLPPKPAPQKSYALLSDAQIAAIKTRLRLSPSQEAYWPGVEASLRAIARRLHATRQTGPNAAPSLDPDSDEVQQLKSAALPLLFQLREDQKQEVRALARLIGLHAVAAQI